MSWSQTLLIVAILAVFLLWRRARRQVTSLRQEIEEHRERHTFTFEAVDDADGRRFVVLDARGDETSPETLTWNDHGLEVVPASTSGDAVGLEPGAAVELMEDAGELVVWDRRMTRRLGVVEPHAAGLVRRRLDENDVGGCIVLRIPSGSLGRMDLLLVHAGVDVDL